jgi:hypothetical protein
LTRQLAAKNHASRAYLRFAAAEKLYNSRKRGGGFAQRN